MSEIEDLVQAALNKDYNAAHDAFTDVMNTKIQDAMEQEKINIANRIYNEYSDDEIDEEDEELTDEEIDDVELEDEDDEELEEE